jgi:hypothetical protein
MIWILLVGCTMIRPLLESSEERLIRLQTQQREQMDALFAETSLGLESSSGENGILGMAKGFLNSVTKEAVESDCLRYGQGLEPRLQLAPLQTEEGQKVCKQAALRMVEICGLQKELGKELGADCR